MRRAVFALLFALVAFAAAGCRAEREAGELVVGLEGTPTTLDPRYAADAYATRILPLLFDTLVTVGPDGALGPGIASDWRVEDGLAYTFTIRESLTFSDGTALDAADVAANLDFVRNPDNGCPASSSLAAIASISAPDARTLVVTLSRPFAPFLLKLARGVIPAESLGDPSFGDRPVGSGPYRVETLERGSAITLVRNARYDGPRPTIERIRFAILPNETTRLLNMKNGSVDLLLNNVPPYALRYFEREPTLVVERSPGINFSYLGFNLEDPRGLVSRVGVRQAIASAIDRDAIIDALLLGQARKADALLAPENWAHAPDVPVYDYDPDRARALLDAEGLTDPDGDGPAPRFTLSYKTSTDRLRNRVAEVIADQLARVGIAVEKRQYEWGTFFADIKAGNFETFTLTWVGVIDPDHLHYVFHSSSLPPGGANRGRFRDARVDAWLEAARAVGDGDERRALYRDAQRVIAEQVVYVPLWWADNVVVRTRRLEGFAPLPGGEFTSLARARLVDAP